MELTPENLNKLRLARGESREQFAQAVGVTSGTVYNWEVRGHYPQTETVRDRLRELFAQLGQGGENLT